jgi:hypothetical protein
MKTIGRLALAAGVTALVGAGNWSLSARAADLGGDCCSDLEERVAELEATAARKGNRKVSLEISGQVDRMLLIWNDGKQSDAFFEDNTMDSTQLRFKGTAQMTRGWKAGFYEEYEFRDAAANGVSQTSETGGRGTDSSTGSLNLRQSNVFVESDKYGRITLGLQNNANKNLTFINLSGSMSNPQNYYAAAFKVRGSDGTSFNFNWANLSNALDGNRQELIRYDSPELYGFIFTATWGQNDIWDAALRYQGQWNSIRVAAGIGYAYWGEQNCGNNPATATNNALTNACLPVNLNADQVAANTKTEIWSGSISAMHVPTGLYFAFAAGTRHITNPFFAGAVANNDANYAYGQGGITKRFFDVGPTTFYGEYGSYQDFGIGDFTQANRLGARITSSDTRRWGAGFTQTFDHAALDLYVNYLHYSADIDTTGGKLQTEDWDAVYTGARIKF